MTSAQIAIHDNPDASRYEAWVDGELAGFAVYRLLPGKVVFVHTEVGQAWEGHGVGTVLAGEALDEVRRQGKQVTPLCPFIAGFIHRHPEYVELVDEQHRSAFERLPR
ncbi:MAG: GNAT family N-acetyltransferase [Jatrophihabitantaceae bacterium]